VIERETLREFSVTCKTKRNDTYVIQYGYDVSIAGCDYYVRASINGEAFNSDRDTLDKIRRLHIQPINELISLIGCDETGIQNNSSSTITLTKSYRLDKLTSLRSTIQSLRKLYYRGIDIGSNHSVVKFEGYLKNIHYPSYYKRDMDMLRSSRIRLFKTVLHKDYIPLK
jgi:hypothetical protein